MKLMLIAEPPPAAAPKAQRVWLPSEPFSQKPEQECPLVLAYSQLAHTQTGYHSTAEPESSSAVYTSD